MSTVYKQEEVTLDNAAKVFVLLLAAGAELSDWLRGTNKYGGALMTTLEALAQPPQSGAVFYIPTRQITRARDGRAGERRRNPSRRRRRPTTPLLSPVKAEQPRELPAAKLELQIEAQPEPEPVAKKKKKGGRVAGSKNQQIMALLFLYDKYIAAGKDEEMAKILTVTDYCKRRRWVEPKGIKKALNRAVRLYR